jgi:hypothetical protein
MAVTGSNVEHPVTFRSDSAKALREDMNMFIRP